jgi:hypothetical protein
MSGCIGGVCAATPLASHATASQPDLMPLIIKLPGSCAPTQRSRAVQA